MSTGKQDRDFLEDVVGTLLLENAIDWISRNMEPEDVFSTQDLDRWAKNNGYVEEE